MLRAKLSMLRLTVITGANTNTYGGYGETITRLPTTIDLWRALTNMTEENTFLLVGITPFRNRLELVIIEPLVSGIAHL